MTLQAAITDTLRRLRRARFDGDLKVIDRIEQHLNDLFDRLPRTTKAGIR